MNSSTAQPPSLTIVPSSAGKIATLVRPGISPCIIGLHGIQGTKELFTDLVQERGLHAHALLVPDLPGFGDSRPTPNFSFSLDSLSTVVEELAEHANAREVVIIGHSLGGMIGVKLLSSTRISLKALASLEGNLTLEDCGASRAIAGMSRQEFMQRYAPRLIADLQDSTEKSAPFRRQALDKVNLDALYAISRSIVDESRSGKLMVTLQTATCPRLLLVGKESSFSSRVLSGGVTVRTIPGAGHFMVHDNYPAVDSCIREWFTSLSVGENIK